MTFASRLERLSPGLQLPGCLRSPAAVPRTATVRRTAPCGLRTGPGRRRRLRVRRHAGGGPARAAGSVSLILLVEVLDDDVLFDELSGINVLTSGSIFIREQAR